MKSFQVVECSSFKSIIFFLVVFVFDYALNRIHCRNSVSCFNPFSRLAFDTSVILILLY